MRRDEEPVRIAGLLAKLMMGEITESEKGELVSLIGENGLDNATDLEKVIRQEIPLVSEASEKEALNRVLAGLRKKIRRKQIPLHRRILRYAAVLAAGMMVAALGWYMAGRHTLSRNDTIFPLASETLLEYPSGQRVAVPDKTVVSMIVRENKITSHTSGSKEEKLYKIKVPLGSSHTVTLDDGTVVHLYPGSELHFPAVFGDSERWVRLSGEGYFDVTHNEACPFVVQAGETAVTVLGTSFNVRAYKDEATIETTLVSGKVQVNETLLSPNQTAVFNRDDHSLIVEVADGSIYRQRAQGVFVFDNRPLDEIMRELTRWFDFDYSYADETLKEKSFRLKLPHADDFNRFSELMQLTGEIEFRITGRHVEILPAKK